MFYSYIKLNGGDEFKFVKTPGNWGSAYGKISASGTGFTTGYNQGGNFQVATTGVYRLTIDIGNNIAYVQQKQVGVVGNMQGWNPGTPIFGGYAARDRFLIVAQSNGTDEFKFHDGPVWDNSAPDKARWWGIGSATGNLDNDGSGGNVVASTSPRTRCIWDGTNPQQVKYNLYPADQMRIVGDGMDSTGVSDWNPASSPKMTYLGNGQWKLNIKLKVGKGIKFLSGSDWGAFDYEDRGDGGTSGSTTIRKISWDDAAGTNFNTPATAGRYNITLDENTQTVTITP